MDFLMEQDFHYAIYINAWLQGTPLQEVNSIENMSMRQVLC